MTSDERIFTREVPEDPYALYDRLRAESPVYHDTHSGMWIVTGYDAVYGALRDHETFASGAAYGGERETGGGGGGGLSMVLINDDPPRHTRFRQLVNKAFTPRRIADLEPWIGTVVDELLDAAAEGDAGAVEIVDALTVPLPVTVIATLLGIPTSERERFKRWSSALLGGSEDRMGQIGEMMQFLNGAIAEKRVEPDEDLITALAAAELDGERLEDWEVLGFCVLLLVAGNETTTNLIGNMLDVLVDRPELWAALRDDRDLVEPVLEETLRYDSPVQMLFRNTTRDTELDGVAIPEHSPLLVSFAAANRDPAGFDAPGEFRLDRELTKHVGFGMGVHYCLGSPLARAEARIGLNALLDRYATIERGEGAAQRQRSSQLVRGFERLPLRFTRA
jgi:cytochrome P450